MKDTSKILNDIISVTRDGKEFYEHAASKVDDSELMTLFARMATVKGQIVSGLSTEIKAIGDTPADKGTLAGDLNQMYGDLRALLGNKDYAYVAKLEDSEDRLLKAFDQALADEETPASTGEILRRYLPPEKQLSRLKLFLYWHSQSLFFGHAFYSTVRTAATLAEAVEKIEGALGGSPAAPGVPGHDC